MALTLEQKALRSQGIGGSDAAAVVGLSPYKTPFQLYCEKRGDASVSEEETDAMRWGSLLEEPIADEYARRTQRKIRRQPTIVSRDYPFMLVNVDRQILGDPRGPGVLEVKSYGEWSARHLSGIEDCPDHVYLQVQHALAVTEYTWGAVAMLVGGQKFLTFEIPRQDAVITELIRQERVFWDQVQAGVPPPIDGSERTASLIKRLYLQDTGAVLTLDAPELLEAARHLVQIKAAMKVSETEETRLENVLKSAVGEASEARLPGFGAITWKRTKDSVRTGLDEEKLQVAYPDAYAACLTTETKPGSRRFLLKPDRKDGAA